jgi:Ni,Fe-hydrogenase I small subunit
VHKCQQKLSTTENKRQIFVDEVETQSREKPLRGSQTQEFHYLEDKTRYKIVALTYTQCSGRTLLSNV